MVWKEEKSIKKWLDETSNNTYKIIIAPHEIGDQRIKELQSDFKNSTLYTNINSDAKVLILNKIGILKNVYRYADIAIIGGGFNKGIHNILEAVTFHIPVLFGPKYQKFEEATDLLDKKLVFSFSDYLQLHILLGKFVNNTNETEYITSTLAQFVEQNHNVSNEIINEISEDITLQTLNPK